MLSHQSKAHGLERQFKQSSPSNCRKPDKAVKTPRGEILPPTLLLVAQIL